MEQKENSINVKVQVPKTLKFTLDDTYIADPFCKDDVIKTLKIVELLGISFVDECVLIINHLMELE